MIDDVDSGEEKEQQQQKKQSKKRMRDEILEFLKRESLRNPKFMFKQLYPFNAACNDEKNEVSFKRI